MLLTKFRSFGLLIVMITTVLIFFVNVFIYTLENMFYRALLLAMIIFICSVNNQVLRICNRVEPIAMVTEEYWDRTILDSVFTANPKAEPKESFKNDLSIVPARSIVYNAIHFSTASKQYLAPLIDIAVWENKQTTIFSQFDPSTNQSQKFAAIWNERSTNTGVFDPVIIVGTKAKDNYSSFAQKQIYHWLVSDEESVYAYQVKTFNESSQFNLTGNGIILFDRSRNKHYLIEM